MSTPKTRKALGRYAAAARWGKPDLADKARDLAAARIEDYVCRVVRHAPALTTEQCDRIAALLRGGNQA